MKSQLYPRHLSQPITSLKVPRWLGFRPNSMDRTPATLIEREISVPRESHL